MKKLLVVSCIIVTITGCVKTTRELSSPSNRLTSPVEPEKTKVVKPKAVEDSDTIYMLDQNKCKIFVYNNRGKEEKPKQNESITWSGNCVDGYGDGMGTWSRYTAGKMQRQYIGKLKEGKAYGKGTLIWYGNDGNAKSKYIGGFEDGWRKGKGIELFFSPCSDCGVYYTGQFEGNSKHGQGEMIFHNGDSYSGEWRYDSMLGKTKNQYAAEREAARKSEREADRRHSEQTENCQHIYTGKHITLRHDMGFLGKTSYIVDGFSPEQGLATIRARFDDSRVREVRCNQID